MTHEKGMPHRPLDEHKQSLESDYKVYVIDSDGSERLGTTISATSIPEAWELARRSGIENISDVVKDTLARSLDEHEQLLEGDYKIYVIDSDGSERLGTTISATSIPEAWELARRSGIENISDVVKKD